MDAPSEAPPVPSPHQTAGGGDPVPDAAPAGDDVPIVAIEYEPTPEDWEAANAAHLFSSRLQRQMIRRAQWAGVGIFGVFAAMSLLGAGGMAGVIAAAIAALIFVPSVEPLQRSGQRRALRKLGREGVMNGTFGPHRVEVRPDGLRNATPHYEWLIRWSAIERVREEDGTFLIYAGPNSFLPIPSTAFRDARALRDFADAFYRRVAQSAAPAARRADAPPPALDDPGAARHDPADSLPSGRAGGA